MRLTKKNLSTYVIVAAIAVLCVIIAVYQTRSVDLGKDIEVAAYDPDVDYMEKMVEAAQDGSDHALLAGVIYEKQRNLKIQTLGLPYEQTTYFLDYETGEEILQAMEPRASYTEDDLDLLAHIIYAEAGSSWIPDRVQLLVGSVVLNRVAHKYYPNTIYDVIYQKGQYSPTWNGAINKTPDERAIRNAKTLLEYGSICPEDVVYQSQKAYGPLYEKYYDSILGTTTYFCYYK